MSRRVSPAAAGLALVLASCAGLPGEERGSLLIRGATIVDGTGAQAFEGDVLVRGDTIVRVGRIDAGELDADRVVEARGRVLAPGFIDSHAHGDPLADSFESFLAMGVTTVVLGQDGSSAGDLAVSEWTSRAEAAGLQTHVALLSGHGSLRTRAGVAEGVARPALEELARMEALLASDLAAGAFGMSTGLEYAPGRWAETAELVALARVVGDAGGVVVSHLRNEDEGAIEGALEELFAQGAHARVHVSHLKVVYGKGAERAHRLLQLLTDTRARGVRVSADVYPYAASYTGTDLLFPDWALPPAEWAEVLRTRRAELASYLERRVTRRNGPDALLFGAGAWAGRTLAEVAREAGRSYADVLIDDVGPGGPGAAHFVMNPALQDVLVTSPSTAIASDGGPRIRHPRGHGTFARLFERHVVARGALSVEEAVRKATGLPASILGLEDRGVIRVGARADLLLFDPERVRERATWADPLQFADGFELVVVNGHVARENGVLDPGRHGRVLRRGGLTSAEASRPR